MKAPQHRHHVKRMDDSDIVYATVQVTQYITMTAGQSAAPSVAAFEQAILGTATTDTINTQSTGTSTTSATPSSSTSSSKKGLAWASENPASYVSIFDTSSALDWYFNWGESPTSGLSMSFIHQQWGSADLDDLANVATGSTVIGFNEPDGTTQATMSAASAAALYLSDFTPLRKTGQIAYLGTPSITNGASGIIWLTEFMTACAECQIDFVSAHWYGSTLALFQSQMTALNTVFNLPVWVTEMACTNWSAGSNPSDAEISAFMTSSVQWIESQSWLERYAWFGALQITDTSLGAGNMLITSDGTALSALGQQYLSL